ncbi:redoxin domain-containing protein [bacterium]|nr:redoxin domain-containing protein [bacterium]
MMKRILTAVVLLMPVLLFAQEESGTTKLNIWPEFKKPPYAANRVKGHSFRLTITDMPETEMIIAYHQSGKTFIRDTVQTDNKGEALVEGDDMWDGGIYLVAVDGVSYFEFVYSATESGFSLSTNSKNPLKDMKTKGSRENELFVNYQLERIKRSVHNKNITDRYEKNKEAKNKDSLKILRKMATKSAEELKNYQLKLAADNPGTMVAMIINLMREPEVPSPPAKAMEKPDADSSYWKYMYFKQHFWDFVDFSDDRILRTPIFRDKVNRYIGQNLTVQIPDSICVSAMTLIDDTRAANKEVYKNVLTWIMSKYENSNIMGMNAVVVCIGQKYYLNDPEVDWLKAKQKEDLVQFIKKESNVVMGKKAHELVMLDIEGVPRSLYAVDADYTIMYFYSATCGHCKKTTPKMKKIWDDYRDKGVKVYAVNTDYKEVKDGEGNTINLVETKEYHDYVKNQKLDWINVADPMHQTRFRDYYNIYSTPVIYLLDKDKNFIGIRLDWITLRKMLLHEVDGMDHDEIEKWMTDHGYVPEEGEGSEEEGDEDSSEG